MEIQHPKTEHHSEKKVKISIWKVATVFFALLFIIAILSKGFTSFSASSPKKTAETTLVFINKNLLQQGVQATLISATEEKGVIKATLSLGDKPLDIYITKDGSLFFPQGVDTTKEIPTTPTDTTPVYASVDDDASKGSQDAPVTIVEFSDFECPYCEKFYTETLPQIEKDYIDTGKVKLVFRDYPLNPDCNPSMTSQLHPDACKAAEAAECAKDQGKFWEYHNKLFENQQSLSIVDLKSYAVDIKLDTKEFNSCLDSGDKAEEVSKDAVEGSTYGVSGTPWFSINGQVLSGAYPFSAFKEIIDAQLATP